MLAIAENCKTSLNRVIDYVDLSVATFDLARNSLTRFRSAHAVAVGAKNIHAKARALPLGLSLACEGAYLSACAQFEQGVRDLIEEAAIQALAAKGSFSNLPSEMQKEHTKGCGNILRQLHLDKFTHLTESRIIAVLHGCVVEAPASPSLIVEVFSSNDRNFKPDVLKEHVKRLGVNDLWNKLGQQQSIQAHFSTTSSTDATRFARERLERIMDNRNVIVHRGRGFAPPSDAETKECANYCSALLEGLAHVLTSYVSSL